jgi:hypothetical protein
MGLTIRQMVTVAVKTVFFKAAAATFFAYQLHSLDQSLVVYHSSLFLQ